MKKLQKGRKFHRERDQRRALLNTLASSLILKGKIKTTLAKAKALSPYIQKKITRAKKGDAASARLLRQSFSGKVVEKLIKDVASKYKERKGGYVRIARAGTRKSDSSTMAIIEFV